MSVITLLCGVFFLFFGKKYIWFFSGGVGFYLSFTTLPLIIQDMNSGVLLGLSALLAIIFIVLTKTIKRLFVFLIGFVGGGFFLFTITTIYPLEAVSNIPQWVLFIVGGIIGYLFASFLLDWAMMLSTVFMGSYLIISLITIAPVFNLTLYLLLCIIGFFSQYKNTHHKGNLTTVT